MCVSFAKDSSLSADFNKSAHFTRMVKSSFTEREVRGRNQKQDADMCGLPVERAYPELSRRCCDVSSEGGGDRWSVRRAKGKETRRPPLLGRQVPAVSSNNCTDVTQRFFFYFTQSECYRDVIFNSFTAVKVTRRCFSCPVSNTITSTAMRIK